MILTFLGMPKKVIWKKHYSVVSGTDCFELIFGFLRSYWFEKSRSVPWNRIGMFSEPSGRSDIDSYSTLTRRHIFWTTNGNSVHSELQLRFDIHASLISWDQWELRGRSFLPINCARSAFYSGIESKRMRNTQAREGRANRGGGAIAHWQIS